MTQLKDVLHLYTGCEVLTTFYKDQIAILIGFTDETRLSVIVKPRSGQNGSANISFIKPILRKLEDMTYEELEEWNYTISGYGGDLNPDISYYYFTDFNTPKEFVWLLSKRFDLFGLIESGQAIDRKTLKS